MPNQESTNWEGREYSVEFTEMFPSGRTGGMANGRIALALGVLPGEKATVRIAKHKKGQLIADVVSIENQSSDRISPREDHYLHCSPWQIALYEAQLKFKQEFITKSFSFDVPEVQPSQEVWGYRTRIEFGVKEVNGSWSLVLHGHDSNILAQDGCLLASEAMNNVALSTLRTLEKLGAKVGDIKSIVVRESKTTKDLLVVVYVFSNSFPTVENLPESATSLVVVQADPDKLISIPKNILQVIGLPTVREKIAGLEIQYPFHAFFQNNIPLYEQVLSDIYQALPSVDHIVDIYAGVGAIGLSLHSKANKITAYEVGSSMVQAANENAQRNDISSYIAHELSDTAVTEAHIKDADVVIVNPTRRGLSEAVVSAISTTQPEYLVYLSCNHQTQARDMKKLSNLYTPQVFKAYDFYPHTPHVETLLVARKK